MARTLVTGGAGFIGSHLVEQLLDEGHEVCVLDNCSTGRWDNLRAVADHERLQTVECDVADLLAIRPYFEGIDWVFHLAALADIVPSIQHPIPYHRANVDGTIAVLEAARAAGIKRLVYTASSSCYGLAEQVPTPESAPIQPMYPYALSKNLGEQIAMHWSQLYNIPVVSLRLFNVYGPRVRTNGTYGAVFGVFLAQKLAEKPFTVVGDGSQTRDFTFVTDVVAAFIAAARSEAQGEIFNVGSGGTYSIKQLVELLGGPITYIPKRPGEPDCTFADTRKILGTLDWKPEVSLKDGVRIMLEHIEEWRDAPVWDPDSIAEATAEWFQFLSQEAGAK